jgi:hypothetical protein
MELQEGGVEEREHVKYVGGDTYAGVAGHLGFVGTNI